MLRRMAAFGAYDDPGEPPRVREFVCAQKEFWEHHERHCRVALSRKGRNLAFLYAQLASRVTDPRNVISTWFDLSERERAQPNSTPISSILKHDCDEISHLLYGISDFHRCRRKMSARSWQWYNESRDIWNAVLREAIWFIIHPVVEPQLAEMTIASRPQTADDPSLSKILQLAQKTKRFVWFGLRIERASKTASVTALLQSVYDRFDNLRLTRLIDDVIWNEAKVGLLMRGNLEHLLLGLFLNDEVMVKLRRRFPKVPVVRCGDAFLVLCKSKKGARKVRERMMALIQDAGFPAGGIKKRPVIRDLAAGDVAHWLDFDFTYDNEDFHVERHSAACTA